MSTPAWLFYGGSREGVTDPIAANLSDGGSREGVTDPIAANLFDGGSSACGECYYSTAVYGFQPSSDVTPQ